MGRKIKDGEKTMENLKKVAEASKNGCKLYYSIRENAVFTTEGEGRYFLTELIRENTPEEIQKTVYKFMRY